MNIPHRPAGQRPATALLLPPDLNNFHHGSPWFMGGAPVGSTRFGNYTFSAAIGGLSRCLAFKFMGSLLQLRLMAPALVFLTDDPDVSLEPSILIGISMGSNYIGDVMVQAPWVATILLLKCNSINPLSNHWSIASPPPLHAKVKNQSSVGLRFSNGADTEVTTFKQDSNRSVSPQPWQTMSAPVAGNCVAAEECRRSCDIRRMWWKSHVVLGTLNCRIVMVGNEQPLQLARSMW
ncbi:hypothetical protein ZIOFF_042782 [Zingiber officinale]|uniref:Uncharacterized protein n=1 Tax=Zingiber officinale TaxID=94328 RepID=A0A8J5FXZ8_ZINOF|nr:hypothetical protein ZIOFF_042782 [Zingiber officinale]